MTELRFTVLGRPQPAGGKRAFVIKRDGKPTGRVAVVDANQHAKSWQQEVRAIATAAMRHEHKDDRHYSLLAGALNVSMAFYSARPRSHYRSGRFSDQLKDSAPPFPTGRPDALKLARGTEDALTGVVWLDDAQVVDLDAHKRYGAPERCEIIVYFTPTPSSSDADRWPKGAPKPAPGDIVQVLMAEDMARRFEERCLGPQNTRGDTSLAGPVLFGEDDLPTYIIDAGDMS